MKMEYVTVVLVILQLLAQNALTQKSPHCAPGRHVIVHLFEWKWTDIAKECERFLGPYGYCGVQISPPNEHRVVTKPWRPWWERYQPVSYKLTSRSGNEKQLMNMVRRCNAVGVRIYADAVINHMAGTGYSGIGIAGSKFNSTAESFPGVPFSAWDFHGRADCATSDLNIHNFNDRREAQNCRLVGLVDLKTSKPYVQTKIAGFLNNLTAIGLAGYRIDAAKHMAASDLGGILSKLTTLRSDVFGSSRRPFIYQEVIAVPGQPITPAEYTGLGAVTEFRVGKFLARAFGGDIPLKNLWNFGSAWGMLASKDALVFVDNHDNQRGHGGGGSVLTYKSSKMYKAATAFELAWPYGIPRVMSSYAFSGSTQGPPSHSDGSTKDVIVNADLTCGNGWICEHRWRQIYNMVRFRNHVGNAPVANWWSNGNNQIAFSRGNRGFIAFSREAYDLDQTLKTGLPKGSYCDVISGNVKDGRCTGLVISVFGDGRAHIKLSSKAYDAMIAIHTGAKI